MKKDLFFKNLFLIAAVYDFVLGILFFFFYKSILNYFNIPVPEIPAYLQMCAAFVIAIGMGYYFVYKNLYKNIDLVKLGIVYKFAYSFVVIYFYLTGLDYLIFLILAICDIIFMILFIWFLVYANKKD